jgi:hypothetical protein
MRRAKASEKVIRDSNGNSARYFRIVWSAHPAETARITFERRQSGSPSSGLLHEALKYGLSIRMMPQQRPDFATGVFPYLVRMAKSGKSGRQRFGNAKIAKALGRQPIWKMGERRHFFNILLWRS